RGRRSWWVLRWNWWLIWWMPPGPLDEVVKVLAGPERAHDDRDEQFFFFCRRSRRGAGPLAACHTRSTRGGSVMEREEIVTTEEIADRIRAALVTSDPNALEPFLSVDAQWRGCVGRNQGIEYMS